MILAETWYKTYNRELLIIIETFKTWQYYLILKRLQVQSFYTYQP